MALTARDAMNNNIYVITSETTCREARKLIHSVDNHCLVVMDKKKIQGIITNGDFLKEHEFDASVKAIMTYPVITIQETDSLKEAAKIITNNRINQLAVVGKPGELVGMLTERDIMKDLIVKQRQPKLSAERAAIYLAMTNERDKEEDWLKKTQEEGFRCAVTQVGAKADKLAQKLREAAVVAALANGIIDESLEDKIAVSNAIRDAYSQLELTNPGLGGGFKIAIVRGKRLVVVCCFGRSGHALVNGPQQIVTGYSII
jgi:acetoin utilization protein AcuB